MSGLVQIVVDPRAAFAHLSDVEQKQVPWAVKTALNLTANDAQKEERAVLKARFHLRRADWNLKGIYIKPADRATKTSWSVVIQVSEKTSYLDKFEKGGQKVPFGGHAYIWEPNEKVFHGRILSSGDPLRPKNLNLHRDAHGRVIGDSRTFMVKTQSGEIPYVVVQRQAKSVTYTKGSMKALTLENYAGGQGPNTARQKRGLKTSKRTGGTVTLYKLRKRVPIKAQLEFVPTVSKSVQSRFRLRMDEAMAEALRTAK